MKTKYLLVLTIVALSTLLTACATYDDGYYGGSSLSFSYGDFGDGYYGGHGGWGGGGGHGGHGH
jgi:major membrane immunogen (membrane-anchored lipoprotein)